MFERRSFPSSEVYSSTVPGDVEEEEALQLHLLHFGCQVRAVTLRRRKQNIVTKEKQ